MREELCKTADTSCVNVKRAFFPMFVLSPTRSQANTGGMLDWAVHILKFAWLRMHNDFCVEPEDARHPHNACKNTRQLRHKYGVTVLIYGSALVDEQLNRFGYDSSQCENESDTDGRIVSMTFDPAHRHNRFESYGKPPSEWVSTEKNDETRAQFCLPGSTKPERVEFMQGVWMWRAPSLAAGDMINEGHSYRLLWNKSKTSSDPAAPARGSTRGGNGYLVECPNASNTSSGSDYDDDDDDETPKPCAQEWFAHIQSDPSVYYFDDEKHDGDVPKLKFAATFEEHTNGNAVELPIENLNGIVLELNFGSWPDAQSAATHFQREMGITKVVAAGYTMFAAGTTIQCSMNGDVNYEYDRQKDEDGRKFGPTDLNWIPKCMALAVASRPSLDMVRTLDPHISHNTLLTMNRRINISAAASSIWASGKTAIPSICRRTATRRGRLRCCRRASSCQPSTCTRSSSSSLPRSRV